MMLISIIAVIFIVVVTSCYVDRRQLCWLLDRTSHPDLWRAAYFETGQQEKLEESLLWICDAFLLPRERMYALRPSDRLWDIYKRQNPSSWDNMDYETLYDDFESAGHDPAILERHDLTVRQIVLLHAGKLTEHPRSKS